MTPQPGDLIAEKYRVDRVLGEGGMGTVYAAINVVTGKQVAIKWLRPELSRGDEYPQRFLREARVASRLEHPNVVNVFDMGRHEGSLFLVMELLQGEPLSAFLARGRPDTVEFLQLMMPVLRGVYAAHRMGVVHRDLKPDNIFLLKDHLGEAREPKVLDFGISKLAEEALDPSQKQLTREGAIFGTPQYMAPEQVRNSKAADLRSDIYALGVIFYRALSERFPYDADSLPALALAIVEGRALHLGQLCPDLEWELCDVIMSALAADPDARFQSVAEFALALEPWAGGATFVAMQRSYDASITREWGRERTPAGQRLGLGSQRTPASHRQPTPASSRVEAARTPTPPASRARKHTRLAIALFALLLLLGAYPLARLWLSPRATEPSQLEVHALPPPASSPAAAAPTRVPEPQGEPAPTVQPWVPRPVVEARRAGRVPNDEAEPQRVAPTRRTAAIASAPRPHAPGTPVPSAVERGQVEAHEQNDEPEPALEAPAALPKRVDRVQETERNPYLRH